jgi:hypothetical protein
MGEQSAARLAGDDYQHLYSWFELLQLLPPDSPYSYGFVEHPNAGSADDVTLHPQDQRRAARYVQVKFHVETPNVDNKTRNEAIQDGGDPGLVSYLAARDNVKVKSMDPTLTDEVAQLRNRFPSEQLKTFYILRQVPEYDRLPAPKLSLDQYLETWIDDLSKVSGLSGPPNSISELRSTFAKHFPDKGPYREAAATLVDPACYGYGFQ